MRLFHLLFSAVLLLLAAHTTLAQTKNTKAAIEELQLRAVNDTAYTLRTIDATGNLVKYSGALPMRINGELQDVSLTEGEARIELQERPRLLQISINLESSTMARIYRLDQKRNVTEFSLWLSILPPLLAIILALIFREVLLALFAGIWVGSYT